MESKRRSAEDEQELDRRIALIREKNQKIEQRTKEIEEDKARNAGGAPSSTNKPSKDSQPKPKPVGQSGKWAREWDHGKTPAETWRENVPPMDLKNRLASSIMPAGRGGGRQGTRNRDRGSRESSDKPSSDSATPKEPKASSKLEGRVSFPAQNQNGRGGAGASRGRRNGNRPDDDGKQHAHIERKKQHGERRHEPSSQNQKPTEKQQGEKKRDGQRGRRRESDGYAVRKVVGRLVDRVVQLEKRDQRQHDEATVAADAEKPDETSGAQEPDQQQDQILTNSNVPEPEPEHDKSVDSNSASDETSESSAPTEDDVQIEPAKDTQIESPTEPATKPDQLPSEDVSKPSDDSEVSAANVDDVSFPAQKGPDANQNVITLIPEKAVEIQIIHS